MHAHKELWSALALGRPTSAHPRCARTAIMDTIPTPARLTVTTARVTSLAVFLSAPAHGFMAFMDARDSMAALGFTVVAISMIAGIAPSDAGTMVMASAAATSEVVAIEENFEEGTNAAATKEETSTAAEAFTEEAGSAVADAGKFRSLAASKSATSA